MLNKNKKRIAWNKGIKTGLKPWLGKKRPDIAEKQRIRIIPCSGLIRVKRRK